MQSNEILTLNPETCSETELQSWATTMLKSISDLIENPFVDNIDLLEFCGQVVSRAGEASCFLGYPDLFERGKQIAPEQSDSEIGSLSPMCNVNEGRAFLSQCISMCKTSISNTEAQQSSKGSESSRHGVQQGPAIPPPLQRQTAPQRAYYEFSEAERVLGAPLTDREAHEWACTKAEDEGKKALPTYETWTRNLRREREKYGQQKYSSRRPLE